MDPLTPIIIGISDLKNPSLATTPTPPEPASLIHSAILAAINDASPTSPAQLQAAIDSIDVVKTWTWPYADLPGLLAGMLGLKEGDLKRKFYSEHGGDKPGRLVDEAARRLSRGEGKVMVCCGGETLASLSACAAAGKFPPPGWTEPSEDITKVFTPTGIDLGDDIRAIHGIGTPIQVYPLYENAFRAHRSQSMADNHRESARLYAEFAAIAEKNPHAWFSGKRETEETIGKVGGRNRMICSPYPLLMNAFNTVNLASAVILTTTSHAETLGIPRSKWIYPLTGTGTSSPSSFLTRSTFSTSPALTLTLRAALSTSATPVSALSHLDIYSCFPIVPKLAATALNLPITDSPLPLTLLGGLTSFGGAGNNYGMHGITECVRRLRAERAGDAEDKRGLVLCNGGVLTYMYAVVLGTQPREGGGYTEGNPLDGVVAEEEETKIVGMEGCEGDAVVETYTVEFAKSGKPLRGYIVGRLSGDGRRFLANHGDENTLLLMASGNEEIVGKKGSVRRDGEREGRNLFVFEEGRGTRARI
ncbi:acetyl-CoA acetyltransferase-like protein [Dendryphion nanum]|uniref:Acetyl-CoA acetyltransferase-like protein n=1 Tax=Dendryphion nanum TaxID=256645 RepID=A0A9P9DR66_9PLEO|nr:acetyl-CoA acetyltransferase-like protein [Dendryphion nanum]